MSDTKSTSIIQRITVPHRGAQLALGEAVRNLRLTIIGDAYRIIMPLGDDDVFGKSLADRALEHAHKIIDAVGYWSAARDHLATFAPKPPKKAKSDGPKKS
jgi:hypothetical protein